MISLVVTGSSTNVSEHMFEPFERFVGFLGTTLIVAYRDSNMRLGDLQADILGILQRLGKATARDIMEAVGSEKHLAYTTVSTVLDRLHRKGLVRRTRVNGRGGAKYLYSYAAPVNVRTSLVDRALAQLVNAFGPSIVPTIYDSLEQISKEDVSELKRKISRARR